jgi:hypothetical protein
MDVAAAVVLGCKKCKKCNFFFSYPSQDARNVTRDIAGGRLLFF